ncbi:uncharacterized protein LOC141728562 [Zonotrichia albicollis]|uniref:uncharacterized protein LOC141728207 n=1 Tax=Zonotrichia albicollis TaxID=44394 RepID=UPI003D810DC7
MRPSLLLVLLAIISPAISWLVPQPKANVWTTLARALGQDHICLSTATASDPLSTCLVGVPFKSSEFPNEMWSALNEVNLLAPSPGRYPADNPLLFWQEWARKLPVSKREPQEFHLLGSMNATFCIHFKFNSRLPYHEAKPNTYPNPSNPLYTDKNWCENSVLVMHSSGGDYKPRELPKGVFLICGDRAWAGLPPRLLGGPCTFGKLSLLTPNRTNLIHWQTKNNTHTLAIKKRDLRQLDPDCNSEIVHWSRLKATAITVFLPWISAAKTMGELGRLECWVAKQANLTSTALSDLLSDEEITRQATIQNRAAIDYLLLLHNHRCEEFEGLCCLDLSSKAENVHATIDKMKTMVNDIKRETDDWLSGLFNGWGLSGWLGSILKTVILVLFILVVVIVVFSIVFGVIRRMVLKLISSSSPPPEVYHLEALSAPVDDLEASVENTDPPVEEEPIYQPWFGNHSAP